MEGAGPKLVGLAMVAALGLLVLPVLNLAERTKVQGTLNDYLTQANAHVLQDARGVEDYLYGEIEGIVGTDKNVEAILYAWSGTVPADLVRDPTKVPNLPGIKKSAGYYDVSALIVRVYWVQKKLTATRFSEGGEPIGRCFFCASDARVERVLFLPADKLGPTYQRPPADVDFVSDPGLLFEQYD